MNRLADEIFSMALSLNRIAAISYGTPQTFETGSPEAIADCDQRRVRAIEQAQQTLDEMDAFDKKQQEIADRLVNGAPEDGWECGYDPTDDEGGD